MLSRYTIIFFYHISSLLGILGLKFQKSFWIIPGKVVMLILKLLTRFVLFLCYPLRVASVSLGLFMNCGEVLFWIRDSTDINAFSLSLLLLVIGRFNS